MHVLVPGCLLCAVVPNHNPLQVLRQLQASCVIRHELRHQTPQLHAHKTQTGSCWESCGSRRQANRPLDRIQVTKPSCHAAKQARAALPLGPACSLCFSDHPSSERHDANLGCLADTNISWCALTCGSRWEWYTFSLKFLAQQYSISKLSTWSTAG